MSAPADNPNTYLEKADWYARTVNWAARLKRELPVFIEVFGPPAKGGILDAGCGPCRQAVALAEAGYRVTAIDASEEMLDVGRQHVVQQGAAVECVHMAYADLADRFGPRFDGAYCIGNSLAAAGSRDAVRTAVNNFAGALRAGGRLFIQVLNFPPMRKEQPCLRGPRIVRDGDTTYISSRLFHFEGDCVRVFNVTHFERDGWQSHSHGGVLYPVSPDELTTWCRDAGLAVDHTWGNYTKSPFDPDRSIDCIVVATKTA